MVLLKNAIVRLLMAASMFSMATLALRCGLTNVLGVGHDDLQLFKADSMVVTLLTASGTTTAGHHAAGAPTDKFGGGYNVCKGPLPELMAERAAKRPERWVPGPGTSRPAPRKRPGRRRGPSAAAPAVPPSPASAPAGRAAGPLFP